MKRPFVAFHFALVQDVAVLRPLALLAATLATIEVRLLVSHKFASRDADGRWKGEIDRLGANLGVTPYLYESPFDALQHLGSSTGMIIAGSESTVAAHAEAHELFRSVSGYIRTVTLQHGLECVGFVHNARHETTTGRNVKFAAEIAVAWSEIARMHSVAASERSKIYVGGPSMLIDPVQAATTTPPANLPGLICENLHSVRFANARMRTDFLTSFESFAQRLAMVDLGVTLRAHPAGRFTERNNIALPANVMVSQKPLYDIDLREFAFAISAPSTILFDFVLAGVPVAIWVDPDGDVDTSNFPGLPTVSSTNDWWRFNWAARWDRERLLSRQNAFYDSLGLPKDVRGRYLGLLALAR